MDDESRALFRQFAARAFGAAAVLLLASCASAPPGGPFELWPVGPGGNAIPLDEAIRWEKPGVQIVVEPLTTRQREAWLRRHAGTEGDPLDRPAGPTLITFRMRLTATADKPVHLETQSVRLIPDEGGAGKAPFDYTRAFELLRPDQTEGPAREEIDLFMRGLLDGPVIVTPGTAREGLVVFPDPSPESRLVVLVVPFVQVGGETHEMKLAFEKIFTAERAASASGG